MTKYEKGKTYPAPKSFEEAKKIFAAGAYVTFDGGYSSTSERKSSAKKTPKKK